MYVCVCVCVEARPTHTAQRPSNTHRHTSLSFQNTQHFHKTAKQKKKVPHKTLWTSFIKTAIKSLSTIPIQLTDFPLSLSRLLIIRTPYNRTCMHFPLWFNKRNASRSPLLLYISRNSATELLSLGFSKCRCFLSSPSRCPCHAIMRNSAQMVSRKCNGHECCFKESFEKYLAASYYWDLLKMCCVLERWLPVKVHLFSWKNANLLVCLFFTCAKFIVAMKGQEVYFKWNIKNEKKTREKKQASSLNLQVRMAEMPNLDALACTFFQHLLCC